MRRREIGYKKKRGRQIQTIACQLQRESVCVGCTHKAKREREQLLTHTSAPTKQGISLIRERRFCDLSFCENRAFAAYKKEEGNLKRFSKQVAQGFIRTRSSYIENRGFFVWLRAIVLQEFSQLGNWVCEPGLPNLDTQQGMGIIATLQTIDTVVFTINLWPCM